jgi:hypothetical protein
MTADKFFDTIFFLPTSSMPSEISIPIMEDGAGK